MIACVASDQKQKIYLAMTGFRGIAGLCSKMPISINVLLGQRFVDQQNLFIPSYFSFWLHNVTFANLVGPFLGMILFFCLDHIAVLILFKH